MAVTADEVLAAVDDRLRTWVEDVAGAWHGLGVTDDDLLAELALPQLLAEAAAGGKRLRPEMVHWGWVAAGAPADKYAQVVQLGAALELLHVFALVHDDVMDAAELRRGRPSVHARARDLHATRGDAGDSRAFGEHIAILAGDLAHAEADHLVGYLPEPVRRVWRLMVVELVLGQQRDLTGTALRRRDLEQAREVSRLKSGAYTVQRPLQLGALIGGADHALVEALMAFGWHAGEVFGLRDDALGIWGDPARTGKSVDDDLEQGKATVALALASQHLGDSGRELLVRVGQGQLAHAEVQELRQELDRCGVRERVETLIERGVDRAREALASPLVPPAAVEGLTGALERLAWRQS
ncbi:polyprenyl synthetase family protein [Aestuariimicrobium sp. p3-SID1156]|uniref:polyprenyl synthetase family protein n=1 Tax=Aestuariimicrobium sp. p3-SID1156 TaxID=2916038 RepID=UPI00223ADDFE|nr:polyprenyl synthetase family protein [Aestuariimicrobium sp. p3-SID1156]MCT1458057.1 polyprenyl synthetase family protein [Aestuariimicrobium sp. p3-SID1156]